MVRGIAVCSDDGIAGNGVRLQVGLRKGRRFDNGEEEA